MQTQFWAVSLTTADCLALITPQYRSQTRTAHALSSLKQAHRIIITMITIMSRMMTTISMHMITVMITVTVIINIITLAMIRRKLMMEKIMVIVNPIATWFDLVGCRVSQRAVWHYNSSVLRYQVYRKMLVLYCSFAFSATSFGVSGVRTAVY